MIATELAGINLAVMVASCVLAGVAFGANSWAAYTATGAWRFVHTAIAGMSGLYTGAYLVLVGTDVNLEDWSQVMRGVSLWVWLIVWILPAVIRIKTTPKIRAELADRFVAEVEKALVK